MEYGTPAYWGAVARGEIAWADAEARETERQVRRGRALSAPKMRAPSKRERAEPPRESRQYAPAMPTAPARDQRLTPTALRLLVLLAALAGRGDGLHTTKAGLAGAIGVHPKSVQKSLALLDRLGYITRGVWRADNGMNRGLIVTITSAARPFWHGKPMGAAALPHLNHSQNIGGENERDRLRHDQGRIGENNADRCARNGARQQRAEGRCPGHRPEQEFEHPCR